MLKALGFHFTVPTTYTFLTRYVKAAGYAAGPVIEAFEAGPDSAPTSPPRHVGFF